MKVGGKGDNHALPVSLPDVSALGATKTEIIQRQNYEFRGNSHHLIWRPEDGQVSMAFCMDAFLHRGRNSQASNLMPRCLKLDLAMTVW